MTDLHALPHPGHPLAEEGADGSLRPGAASGAAAAGAVGMSAATAKRFKHEKTLVLLNPMMGGEAGCIGLTWPTVRMFFTAHPMP